MSARAVRPLCACGCLERVKAAGRIYASKQCSGKARRGVPNPAVVRARAVRREQADRQAQDRIREQLRGAVSPDGFVEFRVAVSVATEEYRRGYRAGYMSAKNRYAREEAFDVAS